MAVALSGTPMKDRAKVTPTLRVAAGASVNSGTTDLTITVPNTAQAGDWAIFFVTGATTGTCSTPTGLIAEHTSQIGDTANQPYIHIFSRRLAVNDVASDLGITFTFTTGSSDGLCGGVMVFANAAGFGVRPTSTFEPQAETLASVAPQVPSVVTGPSSLYVGCGAVTAYLSSGLAAVTMTTPPSGCTIQINAQATRSGGTGGTCRGFGAWTGPTHAAATESCAFTAAQQWASTLVFSVAPNPPHLIDTQAGPNALAGIPVYNYANSSGSCVTFNSSNINRGAITYRPWPERVQQAFGPVVNSRNMAMGGARSADLCTAMYGTATYTSVRSGANNSAGYTNQYIPEAVTKTGLTSHRTALYTTDLVGNDFLALGATAPLNGSGWSDKAVIGSRVSMYAMYRLLRSDDVYGIGQGGQTSTGTWTAVTSDGCIGGGATKTTTPGDKISIALTSQDTIDIVLLATDDVALASGYAGAAYVVKVDGNVVTPTVAPGTTAGITANQMLASGVYNNYKFCQMVLTVSGIGAGAHTVTVEHAGSSGQTLQYNGYMTPLATPPWIIAKLSWPIADGTQTVNAGANQYVTWAGYSSAAVGKAALSAFNQVVIDCVAAASGNDGRIIIHDPEASGLFTRSSASALDKYINDGDGIHPSEVAHALWAREIIRLLTERVTSAYIPVATPASLYPTTLPNTFTMLGTRDLTVQSTWTGILEAEGGGGAGGGGALGLQGRGAGGAAYAKKNTFTLTAGSVIRIVVARGGVPAAGATGGNGMASQVTYLSGPDFAANTVLVKADFGVGGAVGATIPGPVGTGGQAANCVGDVKTSGSSGSTVNGGAAAAPLGGAGATGAGPVAGGFAGGGGAGSLAGATAAGGAGGDGVVKFT